MGIRFILFCRKKNSQIVQSVQELQEPTLDLSRNPIELTRSRNCWRLVKRLVTSAIKSSPLRQVSISVAKHVYYITYPGLRILQDSRMQFSQLRPIKLRAQTATSTTWPSPIVFSPALPSDPGSGIFSHISASTTNLPSETKSKETTDIPLWSKPLARAASPHPRSAISVFEACEASLVK